MSWRKALHRTPDIVLTVLLLVGCRWASPAGTHTAVMLSPSASVETVLAVGSTIEAALTSSASSTASPTRTPLRPSRPSRPPDVLPTDCLHYPLGGFSDVWHHLQVFSRLGCALAPSEAVSGTGANLVSLYSRWLREKGLFVVLLDEERRWLFVPDASGFPADAPIMLWPSPELPAPSPGAPPPTMVPPPESVTPGPGTPEAPTAEPTSTPSPEPTPWATSPAQAIPRATWPRGLFPASGRHEWLVRTVLPQVGDVVWSGTSEAPFNGALEEFEGGWLFWDGSICFVLYDDGSFILCP